MQREEIEAQVRAELGDVIITKENFNRIVEERLVALEVLVDAKEIEAGRTARGFEVVADWARKHPDATPVIPKRKTSQAMAYDFTALETVTINPGEEHHFMTDIKAYMKSNECLVLNVRSSIGFKKKLMLVNTQGWIDADFCDNPDNDGNIGICLKNIGNAPQTIEAGERIAQGAFFNFLSKDNDDQDEKAERTGGIGSTGTN